MARNDTTADAFRTLLAATDRFILTLPDELREGLGADPTTGPTLLRGEADQQLAAYRREIEADGLWDRSLLLTVLTDYFTACPPQTEERHILADWAREQYVIYPEAIEDADFLTAADKPLIDHHRRAYAWWAEQSEWKPLRAPFAARGERLAERLQEVEDANRPRPWAMPKWLATRRGVVSPPGFGAPMDWATLDLSADYTLHFNEENNLARVRIEQWPFTFTVWVTDYWAALLGWATAPPPGKPGERTRADLNAVLLRIEEAGKRLNECQRRIVFKSEWDTLRPYLSDRKTVLEAELKKYKKEYKRTPEVAPLALVDSPAPADVASVVATTGSLPAPALYLPAEDAANAYLFFSHPEPNHLECTWLCIRWEFGPEWIQDKWNDAFPLRIYVDGYEASTTYQAFVAQLRSWADVKVASTDRPAIIGALRRVATARKWVQEAKRLEASDRRHVNPNQAVRMACFGETLDWMDEQERMLDKMLTLAPAPPAADTPSEQLPNAEQVLPATPPLVTEDAPTTTPPLTLEAICVKPFSPPDLRALLGHLKIIAPQQERWEGPQPTGKARGKLSATVAAFWILNREGLVK